VDETFFVDGLIDSGRREFQEEQDIEDDDDLEVGEPDVDETCFVDGLIDSGRREFQEEQDKLNQLLRGSDP
jgi:hypothetical protein